MKITALALVFGLTFAASASAQTPPPADTTVRPTATSAVRPPCASTWRSRPATDSSARSGAQRADSSVAQRVCRQPAGNLTPLTASPVARRGNKARKGLAYGAVIGVVAGAAIGFASGTDDQYGIFSGKPPRLTRGEGAAVGAILGVLAGATIGGIWGALTPADR